MEALPNVRKIDALLSEYGESHRNKTNKALHWICIPIIFFSLFGLIRCIPVPDFFTDISPLLNWATIVLVLSLLYYLSLSLPLFIGFLIWSLMVLFGNESLYQLGIPSLLFISLSLFVIAWIGQFIGHGIEGKKPSFLKDLQFLLIGPAWLMHFILKMLGMKY